ncbi:MULTISPECIES: DUF1062 domain-containing protein [unclassified Clostridioides]|uniref:DUF1062 domain-containing protein n=1 Tax=unclassified Clostridioides TaxID=2635829 RepID=UPI001D102178|nr:DUF1062 domain-containing protein [Clostridioides sp. ES-S-0171-01]MCC0688336.1 DUF1062 domain-containing protein [Clostridioides sp. ES-S-0056-01]MCC0715613.1 DUF1062 domain-containing protein [Clostridioides sp. ES-S-0077-01]UDN54417.1 DUF1062 domain-containing protein [Clostridioides sp. ES-S-0054-01]
MQKIIWEVEYISQLPVIRYCKKCGKKTEYVCSGLFRVNAQHKYLDIWLIYKCSKCDTTWNSTIYSRINPKNLNPEILEQFHTNDENLVKQYAMNVELLHRNGAEAGIPKYKIVGQEININDLTQLRIVSKYPSQLKVSILLREKLGLSRKAFDEMLDFGTIKSISGVDLKKSKLNYEIVLEVGKEKKTSSN